MGREDVNNTVDGGSRGIGVQRGEGQVARFGNAQGGFDGFKVAHLSDEDHVGVFAEGGAERICKGVRVGVHFALVHQALLVVMEELDGVLDGDHVFFALGVNLVEHGSQGGGFSRTGRTRHQHETTRFVAKASDDRRQTQGVEVFYFPGNGTKNGGHGAALIENVAAETRQIL